MLDLAGLNETAVAAAAALGVDDAVAICASNSERMIRFANNSVTLADQVDETELTVYLARSRRRAIASTSNLERASVEKFVRDLHRSMEGLPESEYAPLLRKRQKFSPSPLSYDRRIADLGDDLPRFAKEAIDASIEAGGERTAGVVDAEVTSYAVLTSGGTSGSDRRTSIALNVRSFVGNEASGHGLSCASRLREFDPEAAGSRAGRGAREMVGAAEPEAGRYDVVMSPAVAANLVEAVSGAASAFSVDSGASYLAGRLGTRVASPSISFTDWGVTEGGLGGRVFDDEGVKTGRTRFIEKGVLKTYLHNLTTARKWKTRTTGNAGFVAPHPWNLEVGAGDSSYQEMVREMERGLVVTSNWYTRFLNYRTGEFSTVPRDLAYLVEGGRVKETVRGMRLSDDLLRLFSSVSLASRKREWIQWWEVDTPTLSPWVLARGVNVTRAYG